MITISRILGPTDTLIPGNTYQIHGAYTLQSHDEAWLSAFVTPNTFEETHQQKPEDLLHIHKGNGSFDITLPFTDKGFPHLSLYPIDGGDSFDFLYFGSDTTLGNTMPTINRLTVVPSSSTQPDPFPNTVNFRTGIADFRDRDTITITSIRGTAETFTPHNTYQITGTYTLNSQNQAYLGAYVSLSNASNQIEHTNPQQTLHLHKGTGTFTLTLPYTDEGFPHLAFYEFPSGRELSYIYFGTGERFKPTGPIRDFIQTNDVIARSNIFAKSIPVISPINATITTSNATNGQSVKTGDLLLTLEDSEQQYALKLATTQLEIAQRKVDSFGLKPIANAAPLADAQDQVKLAQLAKEKAQLDLSRTKILAPRRRNHHPPQRRPRRPC